MNLDKRLLRLLKFTRLPLGLTVASAILSGLTSIVQAWALARIINRVFLEKVSLQMVTELILLFVLVSLVKAALNGLSHSQGQHTAGIIKQRIRTSLNQKISKLGPLYSSGEKSGELSNTLHVGVETLNAYFSQYIPQLFLSATIPIAILIVVFPFDLLSGFVFLFTAPVIPVFMILIGQTAQSMTQKQWKSLSRMSGHFLDVLQGLSTLKVFGRSKAEAENVYRMSDQFRRMTMNVLKIAFLSALVLEMAATISTAVIAVEIGLRLMYAKMSFEPALFILILAPEFYQPLRQLGARFHAGMEGLAAAQRIFEIMEQKEPEAGETETGDREAGGRNKKIPGSLNAAQGVGQKTATQIMIIEPGEQENVTIEFEMVNYIYPGTASPALIDANLTLQPGTTTALVGHSGAGKSTLANLLLRFASGYSGNIRVNGAELNSIPPEEWRALVSWMPQKPYLFHQSVRENILLANPQATFDELVAAARKSHLHDYVQTLPQNYDTPIGEQGTRLSGGQVQRLALARAFLKDAPLLILDEPASNLDPQLDAEVQQSISELSKNRTVLLIAHRLNSVQMADQIIMLESGKILEQGSHQELLQINGHYAKLVQNYQGTEQ